MAATRQDAWTADDDLLLAEVILRRIREGSTQLAAFEEVGQKLGRTPAACGFRWNSAIRKKYEAAIQIAKAQRQKQKKTMQSNALQAADVVEDVLSSQTTQPTSQTADEISFDAVIRFLRSQKEISKKLRQLEREVREKDEEIARLSEENERMKNELNNVQTDYREVNDDYKALIRIIDRARKMSVLVDEDFEDRAKFKMDSNGNLERID